MDMGAMFEEDLLGSDTESEYDIKKVDASVSKLRVRKQMLADLVRQFDAHVEQSVTRDGVVGRYRNNYFLNRLNVLIERLRVEIKIMEKQLTRNG